MLCSCSSLILRLLRSNASQKGSGYVFRQNTAEKTIFTGCLNPLSCTPTKHCFVVRLGYVFRQQNNGRSPCSSVLIPYLAPTSKQCFSERLRVCLQTKQHQRIRDSRNVLIPYLALYSEHCSSKKLRVCLQT